MIRYLCPRCKKSLAAQDRDAGAKIACPHCGQRLQVPMPPTSKTMLGTLEDESSKTVLGALDSEEPLFPDTPEPPRTGVILDALPADQPPRRDAEEELGPRRERRPRYEEEEDDRPRRRRRYHPCPECGCTARPRQRTKFGGTSVALLVCGVLFWPLLIAAFLVQEKWDVCPECGEWLEQTGTGF
jgi:DNA-directed RNA polymerase subunit RPC12/RpoP